MTFKERIINKFNGWKAMLGESETEEMLKIFIKAAVDKIEAEPEEEEIKVEKMREYIDKQVLINTIKKQSEGSILTLLEYVEAFKVIGTVPTVTQAELESLAYNRGAMAFAERLKRDIHCSYSDDLGINEHIDELLKEMGC